MIFRVNQTNLPDFLTACRIQPIFGAKCRATLNCCGPDSKDASSWIGYENSRPVSAMTLQGGVLACSSDGTIDSRELLDFCREHKVTEIESCRADCEKILNMGIGEMESSWFMEFTGTQCQKPRIGMTPCLRLEDFFHVLQQSHRFYQEHYTFASWSRDALLRFEKKEAEYYLLEADGEIIGCGCIGAEDDTVGTVSSVAVLPEKRHQQYGTDISCFLTNRILEKGKKPVLICGYDAVAALYRSIGFVECGKWGELYL